MKKLIYSIVIVLICSIYNSAAQENKMSFGIKAGANNSKHIIEKPFADFNYKVGYYLGGFANFKINDKFSFQPELMFAMQGTTILISDIVVIDHNGVQVAVGDFKTNINESNIILPLLLQFALSNKWYVSAGPQLGYIINRDEKIIEDPLEDYGNNEITRFETEYDKFDAGLTLGVGFKLNERLSIDTHYFYGLVKRNETIKSSVFNLGLSYAL